MTFSKKLRTAVLVSGGGTNLQALLDAAKSAEFPTKISLVISNNADAYGLERARLANVATATIDHRRFKDRGAFEDEVHKALVDFETDIVCLAGFMRILTAPFVNAWAGRMLNVHPSLLPDYKGLNTYERALADGVDRFGCSVHLVTPDLDDGPVLAQGITPVSKEDTVETLSDRVHALEHRAYPQALDLLAQSLLRLKGPVTLQSTAQIATQITTQITAANPIILHG